MAIEIHFPGRQEFGNLSKGRLFFHDSGVYVKSSDDAATVVYKVSGLMNTGDKESFTDNTIVQTIKDATFKIGDY